MDLMNAPKAGISKKNGSSNIPAQNFMPVPPIFSLMTGVGAVPAVLEPVVGRSSMVLIFLLEASLKFVNLMVAVWAVGTCRISRVAGPGLAVRGLKDT